MQQDGGVQEGRVGSLSLKEGAAEDAPRERERSPGAERAAEEASGAKGSESVFKCGVRTVRRAPRVLILGIDGGSWKVLEPLATGGWMPRLRCIMEEGRRGVLRSTVPYITCPAWNSLVTGRDPGFLGYFGFINLEPRSYGLRVYSYHRDTGPPELWDLVGEAGLSCGVFNLPVVDRPRPLRGYMVPGFLAPDRDFATHPPEIGGLLDEAAGGYRVEVRGFSVMRPERTVRECVEVTRKHYLAMRRLLGERPTDVFMGVFHLPDRVCHSVLNRTGLPLNTEEDELAGMTAEFFRELDGYIGALVDEFCGDETLLALVSDHGFAPCRRGLLLNAWLERKGYLKLKPAAVGGVRRLNQRRVARFLERIGLLSPALRYAPRGLRRLVPEGAEEGDKASIVDLIEGGKVEWSSTLAVAFPNHGIYLNTSDRPRGTVGLGAEREALAEEIREELLALRDPESGEPVVEKVHLREELYRGPRLEMAPDLMVEMREGWNSQAYMNGEGDIFAPMRRADHRREGIYLLRGPGIRPSPSGEWEVTDFLPTILKYLGLEQGGPLDGRPWL